MLSLSSQDFLQAQIRAASNDAAGPSNPNSFLPEWPPAGSLGSGHLLGTSGHMLIGMGLSQGMGSASPFCKSLDMADMCSQLMQAGEKDFHACMLACS